MTKLISLNDIANTQDSRIFIQYAKRCLDEFEGELIGVEMGSAYGGNVQEIANMWKDRGIMYGFDTFKGHPKELAPEEQKFERDCMDYWYTLYPKKHLTYKYQRNKLDKAGLTNAILRPGLITKNSCDDIDHINIAFIDLDILESMQAAYEAVRNKIIKGGYLLLHDVCDVDHIPRLYQWYETVVKKENWEVVENKTGHFLSVLRKL